MTFPSVRTRISIPGGMSLRPPRWGDWVSLSRTVTGSTPAGQGAQGLSRRRWRLANIPLPEAHLLGIAAVLGMHRIRPTRLPGPGYVHRVVGATLMGAATILIARSVTAAGQVALEHPGRLLTTGPYSVSRNPMYVGWNLLHLGVGVVARSGWILLSAPAAWTWVHAEILNEERQLAARFGEEFAVYREDVPRYLPRYRTCWPSC